jgi:hypothetical protein
MFVQQDVNGKTVSACRMIPVPANGDWVEVEDDNPAVIVEIPETFPAIQDQLDALFAGGEVAEAMRLKIASIKAKQQ